MVPWVWPGRRLVPVRALPPLRALRPAHRADLDSLIVAHTGFRARLDAIGAQLDAPENADRERTVPAFAQGFGPHWTQERNILDRADHGVEGSRTDTGGHGARLAVDQGSPLAGVVELALDIGHIHAGPLSVPVRELEIELVQGHPMAVLHCARDWVTNHGLWLDTQTKAQRGDRLARQAEGGTSQVEAASSRDARPLDLAGHLERITDAMSELAASPHPDVRQLVAWQQALQDLVAWGETPPGRLPDPVMSVARFLAQSLDDPAASAAVARSPSTTLLCLDLFGSLL